jgi:hypothetical protein
MIAFVRNGLWVINSDGSNERLLVSPDEFKSMEPKEPGVGLNQFDWIPGTHTILFNTRLLLDYGIGSTDDLYMASAETMQWAVLRHPGEGGDFHISPDGQRVAIITPSTISLMRVDGSEYRILLEYPSVMIPSESSYSAQPIWATDSQSLMVAIPPQDLYSETTAPTIIWQLPIDGTPPTAVSQLPAGYGEFISPDFSKVVSLHFIRQELSNWIYEMHISKLDGSEDTIYLTGAIIFQNWAPDSEHFVLWLFETHSYYLGKAGADITVLTEPSFVVGDFSWVDASHFIYQGGQNGLCELRIGIVGQPSILLAASDTHYDNINYDWVK